MASKLRVRWPRFGQYGVLLLGIAAFFLVTAAPGGGGGGGGGGSGTGGSGGNSSSGGGGLDPLMVAAIVIILLALPAAFVLRLTEMVLLLPAGKYLPVLDEQMRRADFSSPAGRAWVLTRLNNMIAPEDVRGGFVRVQRMGLRAAPLLGRAASLYRTRMRLAGLRDAKAAEVAQARRQDTAGENDVCVLGILCTIDLWTRVRPGGMGDALDLVKRLGSQPTGPYSLYVYYAPDPGRRLSGEEGARLVATLEAAGPADAEQGRVES